MAFFLPTPATVTAPTISRKPSRLSFHPNKSESRAPKSLAISCVLAKQSACQSDLEKAVTDQDGPSLLRRHDSPGRFIKFGGKYVPDAVMTALSELDSAFEAHVTDHEFQTELDGISKDYVGRESPLYFAEHLTEHYKRSNGEGPKVYLTRADLKHTRAHKIKDVVTQALWAKKLGKEKIIAETGGGQHGVAIATICARLGLKCIIYMGAQDMERQALNMFRMKLLGAEVRPIDFGTAEQQDATSEAIQDWETNLKTTHYIFGSDVDQHPYPIMARKFVENKKVGFFEVKVVACGLDSGEHATTSTQRVVGVFHGQIIGPQSTSAGLDNRDVGPEHVFLKNLERAEYYRITDKEAREAFERLFKLEGIIPTLETSYALAYLEILCPTLPNGAKVVVNFNDI